MSPQPQVPNAEDRLYRLRIGQARQKEQNATQYVILAEAYKRAGKGNPRVQPEQVRSLTDQADRARAEADAMHDLAGTEPALFDEARRSVLENMLEQFRDQYVEAQDAADNPEAYGNNFTPPEVFATGIELAEAELAQLGDRPAPAASEAAHDHPHE